MSELRLDVERRIEDVHRCPVCGVAVPSIRLELLGVETCTRCTIPVPRFNRVKVSQGGGNVRVVLEPVF